MRLSVAIFVLKRMAPVVALALGLAGTSVAAFLLSSGHDLDAVIDGAGVRLATTQRTMEAGAWLSARGLLHGIRLSQMHGVSGLEVELIPAPGVELPSGRIESGGIRFNEEGEVVEVLPLPADSPCTMVVVQDTENPRLWVITCVGVCPSDGSPCTPMIDLATLQIVCDCFA